MKTKQMITYEIKFTGQTSAMLDALRANRMPFVKCDCAGVVRVKTTNGKLIVERVAFGVDACSQVNTIVE